jgi:Domain of unknown function (DUF222)
MSAEPSGMDPDHPPVPGPPSGTPGGMRLSWSADVPLEEIQAAADRQLRWQNGRDLPAWGQPSPGPAAAPDPAPPNGEPAGAGPAGQDLAASPASEDPLGDAELDAAESAPCAALTLGDLAGQARLVPGPVLAGWLSSAPADQLDDAGLVNSITGFRKVTSWAQSQELARVAELARRRGISSGAGPNRTLTKQDPADYAPDEVALALTLTQCAADYWMSLAVSLKDRLPRTLVALGLGEIDLARAKLIDEYTTPLDDDAARKVEDKVLARAGQQTTGQLGAALRRAIISVDPEAAERRRKQAERNARVELVGEPDGTASLLGRFLPAAQAAAAWTRIDTIARAMQQAGATGGIDLLRARVLVHLLLGTLPSTPPESHPPGSHPPDSGPADSGPADSGPADSGPAAGGPVAGGPAAGGPAGRLPLDDALRARPTLIVPLRTLAGTSGEPALLSRIGPVTPAVARELAQAAAADATCEWRMIVVGPRGQPVSATRIRSPGRPRSPGADGTGLSPLRRVILTGPASMAAGADPAHGGHPGPAPSGYAAAADPAGHEPGSCSHEHSVPGYRIPDALRMFIEARDQDCGFPPCRRPATSCDLDHTVPYDQGGLTCRCNLSAECRRHHQLKQLPAWRLTQPQPGTLSWRTPARLTYLVTAQPYPA